MAALGDKDVSRLNVSVNDALRVCGIERVSDFCCERKQAFGFERLATDKMAEREAIQIFHRDEGPALVLADVGDRANIRMAQSGGSLGFATETSERLGI